MAALEGLTTYVPRFDPSAWEAAVAEAPEDEQPLIRRQMQLSGVLGRFEGAEASPEVVEWLSLWSRCFGLCDAVRGSWMRQTLFGLRSLERPAFELALQMQVVFEAADVNERLRAYVASCFDADRRYWSAVAHNDHLQRAYDPRPARVHARALAKLHPDVAEMFGEMEVVSDQEAEADRDLALRKAEAKIARIDAWLMDERLAPWAERIATLQRKYKRKHGVEFYSLFNETESSVYQRLNKTDSKHAYLAFSRGSSILHGSTIVGSLRMDTVGVAPLIGGSRHQLAAGIDAVLTWIEWVALVLWLKAKPEAFGSDS